MIKDPFDFSGKIVLVTGGSRGLGRAMVMGFAERGANVVIASRKIEACEAVAAEVRTLGRQALAVATHVGKWNELQDLTDAAYGKFGRVDILVNNAGLSPISSSLADVSEALFDKICDVNFKGPFRLAALIGSKMFAGAGGSIINVSSVGAMLPSPYYGPYAGAKAALNAISIALAREYAPRVRVNVLAPGGFLTDVSKNWADDPAALSGVMMRRFGKPEELVSAALYLASDSASFTTGAHLRVDGGCFAVKA